MNYKFLILTLLFTSLRFSIHAQTKESTLNECHKAYFAGGSIAMEDLEQKLGELRTCIIGKPFPSFTVTTINGKKYSNADLKNKVVIISSWFTECAPCVAEMPIFNDLIKKYEGKEFLILSFATNDTENLKKFIAKHPVSYDVVSNSRALIEDDLHTTFDYPTNIILNKKGEIIEYSSGGPVDENGLEKVKKELISVIDRELAK